jgi:PAS domain S-box-containing protein
MPVLITRLSDDHVVRVNPEFETAYGHTTGSVADTDSAGLHYEPSDRRTTLERQARGEIASVEVRLRSAEGACCWAHADVARFEMDGEEVLLTTFYDIQDRKASEALVAEMARFPEMNPGPVVRLDTNGIIRRSNGAARALLGSDLTGKCFWELCPDFSDDARARVLAGDETVRQDVELLERWLRLTVTHASGTDQIFVYGSDITKEKAAERELAERARFPAMNPGPVARLDAEGFVLRANPAATGIFGKETLVDLSWLDLCPDLRGAPWNRVLADGLVQHEAQLGDRWFSFALRHEPVANQVFVYGSDMTELKAAERALAELARFPEMNPGPVCRLDRRGTVLLANRAAKRLFDTEQLAGSSWHELVPAVSQETWDRVFATDQATVVETRIGDRDLVLTHAPGPEGLFVFVYGSDVTRQREAERALRQSEKMATLGTLAAGVAHELNNPAAAARRAAEQMESSFSALQEAHSRITAADLPPRVRSFLAEFERQAQDTATRVCEMSAMARADAEAELEDWLDEHEVEDPWEIAPVLVEAGQGVADLEALRDTVGRANVPAVVAWQSNTHRVYRLLAEVRHGAARISEIVGAMKAYSYLGQAPVQSVDVNNGIKNTLVILRSKLKEGVLVEQSLSPDLPKIEALGSELNQVWTNLIDNAVHAMGGQGRIRLSTDLVGDRVVVEIEDDGPGIPGEHQSQVFDAFFTTKPPGEGTGLGLHTTYNIVVDKHGGTIRLASEPGRTRFTVELPLRLNPAEPGAGAPLAGERSD